MDSEPQSPSRSVDSESVAPPRRRVASHVASGRAEWRWERGGVTPSPRRQCIRAGESFSSLVHPRRRVLLAESSASAADSDVLLQLSPQPQLLTVQLAGGSSESPAIGLVVARAGHRLGLSAAQLGRRIILHPRRLSPPRVQCIRAGESESCSSLVHPCRRRASLVHPRGPGRVLLAESSHAALAAASAPASPSRV